MYAHKPIAFYKLKGRFDSKNQPLAASIAHSICAMESTPIERIDLGDMALERRGDDLVVTHRSLAEPKRIDVHQLRNWLRRQLREVFA